MRDAMVPMTKKTLDPSSDDGLGSSSSSSSMATAARSRPFSPSSIPNPSQAAGVTNSYVASPIPSRTAVAIPVSHSSWIWT